MKKTILSLASIATVILVFQMPSMAQTKSNTIPKKDFHQTKKENRAPVAAPVTESLENTHYVDRETGEIVPEQREKARNGKVITYPVSDAPRDKTKSAPKNALPKQ
jgi:hypothetical protein